MQSFRSKVRVTFSALKHYTSKIEQYDDLETLGTFGFRGEALSSLCALAKFTIITRHQNSLNATRLEYEPSGLIKKKTSCSRNVGTTVLMENIFYSLPVRHKEFKRNLKREYHKLMHVIQCYCLISEGWSFILNVNYGTFRALYPKKVEFWVWV